MEDKVDENIMLDYALFHISPTKNSYDALACSKGKIERVTGGHLDQLAACLLEAKTLQFNEVDTSFKLQLSEGGKGFSWFTRDTFKRFLHIVNTPETLKDGYTIMCEIAQLEETKKFHISLYAKDHNQSAGLEADTNSKKDVGLNQQLKVETLSSDATKNELLRALDLRLLTLEEELAASFDRVSGVTCFRKHISDISAFIDYFGSTNLRNLVSKLLACSSKNKPCESTSSHNMKGSTDKLASQAIPKSPNTLVSPAKIAQIERESSSESDDSSDSNDEDQLHSERSRSMTRSATPRRSASPMRRIQIGRSGSRRSTPITIKSFNYFPARERSSCQRDNTDETNSGNEDGAENQTKPENTVRRMSVQDAISLFEHKQKDQKADVQKVSATSTNTAKSVLRRWSAGMGDSFAQTSHASTSDSVATSQNTSEEANKNEEEAKIEPSNSDSSNLHVQNTSTETKIEEVNERVTASAEWNRKKEAELNQMLMKMMETKPVKKQVHRSNNSAQGTASDQRGNFYSEYRRKRDEKLRTENLDKRIMKEAQIKVIKESLEVSKLKMISKNVRATGKDESSNISQKPRRNSAPLVLPKKDVLKSTNTKKASPKATSLPATRKSLPQLPSPKTSANAAPRTPGAIPTTSTTTTTINRRKLISTPSPTPSTASKIKKGTPTNVKPNLISRQENSQKSTSKSNKSLNTKKPSKHVDDSRIVATKPSFYNKVTKKSSIVPLESKPIVKKSPALSPKPKPKVSQPEDSAIGCEQIIHPKVVEAEAEGFQPTNINAVHEVPLNSAEIKHDCTENTENKNEIVELSIPETQAEVNDIVISSPAWVEENNQVESASCDIELPSLSLSPEIISECPLSSPKIRHSLSQMLKADNNEPEIIEWGNAENPPALVYQKDAPKGFKRLLKFARKNKGESNMSGFSSPSVFSEGDDDGEEPKANSKRSSDLVLRKAALQAQGYDLPKSILTGSSDGGSSRKWLEANDKMTAQSSNTSTATMLDRLREGQNSSSSSNKATRSFFSLSTFRSSKSSETKL